MMKNINLLTLLVQRSANVALLTMCCLCAFSVSALEEGKNTQSAEDLVSLSINNISIEVEYADEAHERQLGLMFRKEMCADCGMLFKFDQIRYASMWMKNTYIPLDVAYINAFGKITDIKAMEPENLSSIQSSVPILYALEMNQGWFESKGISVGDIVVLPLDVRQDSL
ncbi:DUF192 domain-containing protein [Agaribacter flavus]|uniref:DUF192 domain-containing protein n=1 Tax=Agaribacter flavus TaxID=1902781 RepID=A0ABV7FPF7_9ALTE